jgi:hypothetical protein
MDMNKFEPSEVYEEKPQRVVKQPILEDYNPDDDELPFIPGLPKHQTSNVNAPPQFLDMSNPGQYSVMNNPKPKPVQESFVDEEAAKKPNFGQAEKNKEKYGDMLKNIQDILPDAKYNTNGYSTEKALKILHDSIQMLKDIEYWIPEGKEEYINPLKKIAEPIVRALSAYVDKVEQLK